MDNYVDSLWRANTVDSVIRAPETITRLADCIATKDNVAVVQEQIDVLRAQLAEAMEQIENMKKPFRCKSLL